jgi:Ca-activated chloride channel family protein
MTVGGGGKAAPGAAAPAEKGAELAARVSTSPSTPGPTTGGAAPAKSEGKSRELGEVRKGLASSGYAGDDKDESSIDAFEVPLYRSEGERGRTIAPDWRSRFDHMQRTCWPRPDEKPRDMFFRYWGDNPFEITAYDKLSTFSVDVDTASYTLARKYLADGQLPTKEQIRTEEFVNYFKGDVPAPREGTFNVATEFAPNMFGDSADSWMLRVALRGREVQKNERMPLALTFIIDVSGSMRENERLELVKHALRLLVSQLDARDSISLVKFSNDASLVLPMTSARQRDLIESAINPLQPEGSTNTEAGLRMGYAQAVAALSQGANNRVVLLTDGVANVGITDPNALTAMVENQRKAGIYLNTVGVGMNNHNDNLLEQLADKGDGVCNYVDDAKEVRRALVDNFTGAFETIARDVKIQVEFDATQVERYRLLGYENRAVADADFRNDKVDAGEVGAGHQVIALYEIVRTHVSGDGPLATVHVRYKQPYKNGVANSESDAATEIAQQVFSKNAAGSFGATSAGYRRAVLVAQFAEFLRRSIHARTDSVDRLLDESRKLAGELKDPEFAEFVAMVDKSRALVLAEIARRDWFDRCGDELRQRCYLQAQIDDLQRRLGHERKIDELQRDSYDLQRRLDELRAHLESLQGQGDEETLRRLQAENIELQRRMLDLLSKDRVSDGK